MNSGKRRMQIHPRSLPIGEEFPPFATSESQTALTPALLMEIFGEQPVMFHRSFFNITGSVNAALLLSVAVFDTQELARVQTGVEQCELWLTRSSEEWMRETCLSRTELQAAKRRLIEMDLLHERRDGPPPAVKRYRVNHEWLTELLADQAKRKYPHLA
jgi:hypothetical protein